jgi:hypothetical protein
MAPDETRALVQALSGLDEDELLEKLADQVALGVGPLDPQRKRAIARAWMDAQRDSFRASICSDPRVQAIRDRAAVDEVAAAAAVADLIAAVTGKLPAATAAMLLVRTGLDRLCD